MESYRSSRFYSFNSRITEMCWFENYFPLVYPQDCVYTGLIYARKLEGSFSIFCLYS